MISDADLKTLKKRRDHLAKRIEQSRRRSLFADPIPAPEKGVCNFPGCNRPSGHVTLCASHARQRSRKGWLHLDDLAPPVGGKRR